MKDLARFLAVLAIFVFGFSMQFVALNQPFSSNGKIDTRSSDIFKDGEYPKTKKKLLYLTRFTFDLLHFHFSFVTVLLRSRKPISNGYFLHTTKKPFKITLT